MFTTTVASPVPARATALMRALSLVFASAVAYATLWPLVELRPGTGNPFAFIANGLPRYWTWFDVLSNVLAYVVLALLLSLAWLPHARPWAAFSAVAAAGALMSLLLEAVQHYLPTRVPSLLDWIANSAGAVTGAWLGATLNRAAQRGERIALPVRDRWYEQGPPTGWVLLLLWLSAQLVPQRLLFATGHVEPALQRLVDSLQLPDAPDLSRAADRLWGAAHAPTGYGVAIEAASTICALCAIGAMAFALVQGSRRRLVLVAGVAAVAFGLRSLATQMVYGAAAPFAWLTPGAQGGLIVGAVLLYGLETLGPRSRAVLGLAATLVGAVLVNIAPEDPYFDSMVAGLRSGQLSNLHGLLRSVSVAWPVLAIAWFWRRTARGVRSSG